MAPAAPVVVGPGGVSGRAGHVGQLTHGALAGLRTELAVALGGGHVGHGAHLVDGQVAGAQRPDQVRDVPGLLAQAPIGPGRRGRDPEALGGPGLDRRRTLVAVRLAPLDLAHEHDDPPLGGGLLPEGLIELVDDLFVGQRGCGRDHVGSAVGVGGTAIGRRTVRPPVKT